MSKRTSRAGAIGAALLVFTVVAGCKPKDKDDNDPFEDVSFLDDGTDATATESDSQVLTSTLVTSAPDGTISLASVDLVGAGAGSGTGVRTQDIGDGARAIFFPKPCIDVVTNTTEQSVKYVFKNCMGPNGLRSVTGELSARYRAAPGHLHLEVVGTGLSINNATDVDWSATADITSTGPSRTMVWKASLSGTTAGGRAITRNNDTTVHWNLGDACFELDGFSEGSIQKRDGEARSIRTDITDFRRCRRGCPDPGGKITVTNVSKNKKIELTYDGSNVARFVGPNGRESTIQLLCRP